MILSAEYMFAILLSAMLLLAVAVVIWQSATEQAKAPKIDMKLLETRIVKKSTYVYLELTLQSHSTSRICINFIELQDLSAGVTVLFGDKDVGEFSDLPICIDPTATVTIGAYHQVSSGFSVGSKVLIKIHYSVNTPSTTYDPNNPQTMLFFSQVVAS